MSLDLSAAIEAGARALGDRALRDGGGFDRYVADSQDAFRGQARAALSAAAPLIEQAVREQVAREIEGQSTPTGSEHFRHGYGCGLGDAARIARGGES